MPTFAPAFLALAVISVVASSISFRIKSPVSRDSSAISSPMDRSG